MSTRCTAEGLKADVSRAFPIAAAPRASTPPVPFGETDDIVREYAADGAAVEDGAV